MHNVLTTIVERNLCCSCGACAGVCPSRALHMTIGNNGDIIPILQGRCSEHCSLCITVCPMQKGEHAPRNDSQARYQTCCDFHPVTGPFEACYLGARSELPLRNASSSGGLLTWILEKLLSNGMINKVAVVLYSDRGTDGLFHFSAANSIEQLRHATKSIYYPVNGAEIIRTIVQSTDTWAIVGVPCFCTALRKVKRLENKVRFVMGLACGMYQNDFYTRYLISKSETRKDEIISKIVYRGKVSGENTNNFAFWVEYQDKGISLPQFYLDNCLFLGQNAFFRQNACNYCRDVFAEMADACFMDAWLPEFLTENSQARSLVIVRNHVLNTIFQSYIPENSEVELSSIPVEKVVTSQHSHVWRKQRGIDFRKKDLPWDSLFNKISWKLQLFCQERSKRLWRQYPSAREFEQASWYLFTLCRCWLFFLKIINKLLKN